MAPKRTERLLNLLIALLARERGYSREELRRIIPPYAAANDVAFERMFDRDIADLRELGLPVETFTDDPLFENDLRVYRYRIRQEDYRLPPVQFTTDESAVLSLASRMWQQASLGSAAGRAMRKLSARTPEMSSETLGVEPRIRATEPAFGPLLSAIVARRSVRFGYQRADAAQPALRRLQPWGIGNRFGHWYVVGWDEDRDAERTFRLSRMTTAVELASGQVEIPEGFSIQKALDRLVVEGPVGNARLRAQTGTAAALRSRASDISSSKASELGPQWDEFSVEYADVEILAEEIAAHGPHVRVLGPDSVRDAVLRRLRAASELYAREDLPDIDLDTAPSPARTQRKAADDLNRLLDLVPYLTENPGAPLPQTARRFGVSERQLVKDLELLFVCGLPGYGPDQLIDAWWDEGNIFVTNAEELREPVRLSVDEAGALIVGLQALAAVPGVGERSSIESALAKISSAASDAVDLSASLHADIAPVEQTALLTRLQSDIAAGRRLVIDYLVPHRDEVTERTIDPWRLFSANDQWYLQAWCYRADDIRNFRLDRMTHVRTNGENLVDEKLKSIKSGASGEGQIDLFSGSDDDVEVTLLLAPRGRWIADHYLADRTQELPGGWLAARLSVGVTAWLSALSTRHGGDVRVLAPQAEAEACAHWVTKALP